MKKTIIILAVVLLGILAMNGYLQTTDLQAASKSPVNYNFNIKFRPKPPIELDFGATPEQLVSFAWEEFLALNWQSSYPADHKRDNPAGSWSYSDPAPFPGLVVWETYAHRTELRPASDFMRPFDASPLYSYKTPPAVAPGASTMLFDNLDENNEIGSCNVYAHVGTYGQKYQVLYQAKVNRDEYEYILKNYPTNARLLAATKRTQQNISKDSAYYPGGTTPCNCPLQYGVLCLPCGGSPNVDAGFGQYYTGAMEVKTGWRQLTPLDDATRYFTRTVLLYEKINNVVTAVNKTYALIGLHIIHKTYNYPNFIFATFEHVDVEKSDMGYVLLDQKGNDSGGLVKHYPRLHPIPAVADSSTAYVHRELKKMNPQSIWQYYRLVGVQGEPTNNANTFSFFLANYVIESDPQLANFRGSSLSDPFNGGINNLYRGHGISMGGCQGCHGVGQINLGTDCSFLMDQVDKPVNTPDIGNSGSKLQRYIRAVQEAAALQKARKK